MEPPWSLSALSLVFRPTVAPPCLNKGNLLLLRSFPFSALAWTIPYRFSLSNSPGAQYCKLVQSIGAHGQRYKLWLAETKDELLVIQRMEQNQYLWGSTLPLSYKTTWSPFPSLQIWYLSHVHLYSPSQNHSLASSHFCKLMSICSNLICYHWFRDNLEQILADSCDSNLPCCSP